MLIFPAIDLRDGQVVRLTEGDYDQMTVYGSDPLAVANSFREAGAEYLHVVDLDAAKDGGQKNFAVIEKLALKSGLKLEVGGGARNEESAKRYLDAGVKRIILGTLAVEMESTALYLEAARAGKRALAICTISDHLVTGEATTSEERQNTFTQMMEIALETAILMEGK